MLQRLRKKELPPDILVQHGAEQFVIRIKANNRAKNYQLRIPPDRAEPVLTVPKGGSLAKAESFARRHAAWLSERLSQRPDMVSLFPGDRVPYQGEEHIIIPLGKLRGLVNRTFEAGQWQLLVPGSDDHIPRKVQAWLRQEAKAQLTERCRFHAAKINKSFTGISVRDTSSRWGSCSSTGRLSFSWRLILAPPEILDYVAAHEVAHLVEMNHSSRFWKVCNGLAPHTPEARKWLRDNGVNLHRYGQ
ncbi:hypothetical protein JM93_03384 [Roseibium hamelinense]|uniref:YgjP-like metallopeptidase domain-containing protein n=1 Tax=Roseibium hamelinense TaxID=150831 RepID=A0A562SNH6_9HYPH|nr:SprT family zinc-dependent metalloprotease [Roseibium hamelinense]MTI44354.1 M48 family peptidase [Roseibium hamelinense]TWI82869.1 hypothetical protein JM93_03384 [Roseibium hamelinense]